MLVKSTLAVALLASFVAAQTSANSTIDPSTIESARRSQWCNAEISTCGILCGGANHHNECDPATLNYTCTCASNHSTPGLNYYTQTMPTFICQQIYENCIIAGQNNAAAQRLCTQNREKNCGTIDPTNFTADALTSSSSSAPSSATNAPSGSGAAASTSSSSAAAATMVALGRDLGTGVFAVGVAAAFGILL